MKITLIPFDDSTADEPFVLWDLPAMIGRAHEAQVRPGDSLVSRRHCEIYELEGRPVVRDLESKNGTFVNGHATTETILMPEDRLTVGMTRFLVTYDAPVSELPRAMGSFELVGESAG